MRAIERRDEIALEKWLSNPEVLAFYEGRDNPYDLQKVRADFYGNEPEVYKCIVEFDDVAIGYIQFYEICERTSNLTGYEEEVTYGLDQFIGEPNYWGKGIGTMLVQSMLNYLQQEKQVDVIILDPQVTNYRAIRCYEKCGFKRIKRLPAHEYHEGKYRDCWLMEYRTKSRRGNL